MPSLEKREILKGIECCAEFLCGECPYEKYDIKDKPLACVHKLILDIHNKLIVKCEDCDSAYPCFSPFDRPHFVRCTYLASGDGKAVCRDNFCSAGERRIDNASK